jgi:hypothetical protein
VLMLCRRLASTSVGVSIVNMVRRKPGMVFAHLLRAILNPALADNGGPTRMHALVAGIPAIDTVFDGTCPPPARDPREYCQTTRRQQGWWAGLRCWRA